MRDLGAGGHSFPQASEELLREHYAELRGRPFYSRLVKYMSSGPVVAMVSFHLSACGRGSGAAPGAVSALTVAPAGVAGVGCCARLAGAHRRHQPGGSLSRHNPRGFLRGGWQVSPVALSAPALPAAPLRWLTRAVSRAGTWFMAATQWRVPAVRSRSGSAPTSFCAGRTALGTGCTSSPSTAGGGGGGVESDVASSEGGG